MITARMKRDKKLAEMILEDGFYSGGLQIFASDGTGVREVTPLLSEDQLGELEERVSEFLQCLIEDIENAEEEE